MRRGISAPAAVAALLLLCSAQNGAAYNYIPLPLIDSMKYKKGDKVGPIGVNSLFSHENLVYDDFYSLKFCKPSKDVLERDARDERLGEVLMGDRILPSLYEARMLTDTKCQPVPCTDDERSVSASDIKRFVDRIEHGYRGTFILDNLPTVSNGSYLLGGQCPTRKLIYDGHPRGWAVGVPSACTGEVPYINNHLALHVLANEYSEGQWVIVGFYVTPHSVAHRDAAECNEDFRLEDKRAPVKADPTQTQKIHWTYSVTWHKSDIEWSNRWDAYLNLAFSNSSKSDRIHWLGIVNSSLIILCLATIVTMLLIRALRTDISNYEEQEKEEIIDEAGWKLIHGDVFRKPPYPRLFAIIVGTGLQLLGMASLVFLFALLGFLSPANRGGLVTVALLLFVLMSLVNGYVTALFLKTFEIDEWKPIFGAAFFFPGVLFCFWTTTEIIIISTHPTYNSNPIIINTLKMIALWLCVSLPLVLLGASFSKKSGPVFAPPCKINAAERKIPQQNWYLETWFLMLMPGLIPFGAAFIELRFILSSMWQGMVYYVFGFLSLTAVTVLIVSVEVTVVLTYFLLVHEDYRWWWRALAIPGGMGIHFFLYSLYYAQAHLRIVTFLSIYIYVSIMFLFSFAVYIAIGAIGVVAGYFFVRVIYSSVKID